jgi:hypothetical protein
LRLQRVVDPKNAKITCTSHVKSLYGEFCHEAHLDDFYNDLKWFEIQVKLATQPTSSCPPGLRQILESRAVEPDSMDWPGPRVYFNRDSFRWECEASMSSDNEY